MRRGSAVVVMGVLVALVVVGMLLAARGTQVATERSGRVTLVGDSLNVGVEPYVADALGGRWEVETDDVVGRSTADGLEALRRLRPVLAPVVVVSLGTNDPDDASAFRARVREALALTGPGRCVVWATIWRGGGPDDGFNAVLRDEADADPRLRLVAWDELVAARPELLAADGLHGTPAGYEARAAAVADAVRSCPREA